MSTPLRTMPGSADASAAAPSRNLSTRAFTAFLLPSFAVGLMAAPVSSILPTFYAKHTTLTLATIGTVLLVTRILDALADQVVGYFSDLGQSRFGTRKPWLLTGALLCMGAATFLFNPPAAPSPAFLYAWLSIYYVGWTLINVPHSAWACELTGDYVERSRIFSFMAAAGPIGVIVMFAVPVLPLFDSSSITAASMSFMGWVIIAAAPLCCVLPVLLTPSGRSLATEAPSLLGLLRSFRGNVLFWWFIAFALIAAISLGVVATLVIFYLDNYLGLGDTVSSIFIVNMLAMMIAIPGWLKVIPRIGKHRALAVAALCQMVLYPLLLLIRPGPHAYWLFLAWIVLLGLGGAALTIAPRAILADIVDYDTWKTGGNRAGNYYAFLGLTEKAVGGLGGSIALFMLVGLGFDPNAASMSSESKFALTFTMGVFPAGLCLLVVVLVWTFPLDARRHAIIRRRIEQRAARAAAIAAK
ncbi:MAG TPA: MFS transporter [Steroidobacteraceae bacterium]|nr:MFS transporter [Steroidobacteraceae bacterium]